MRGNKKAASRQGKRQDTSSGRAMFVSACNYSKTALELQKKIRGNR